MNYTDSTKHCVCNFESREKMTVYYQCKTLMSKTFKRQAVLTSYLLLHLFHLLRKKNQKINQMYFDDMLTTTKLYHFV